jgi:hypothetical protein
MKQVNSILIIVPLILGLLFSASCKRNAIQEPSPFGPSTFSILLQLSATPNVIFAGSTRETTTITATLMRYDGVALANKTIHFDIRDVTGNKVNIGFFTGNESVKTTVTDQNGVTSVHYYGPFSQELTADSMVYITATVAWEGKEFIRELTPIYIIRNAVDLTFSLVADPNVLWATQNRPEAQLKAYFKTVDGIPLAGRKVYFIVLSGPGLFADGSRKTFALTDANGFATVTFLGPTKFEIGYDQFVTIKGQPETATPFYIHKEVNIRVLREE